VFHHLDSNYLNVIGLKYEDKTWKLADYTTIDITFTRAELEGYFGKDVLDTSSSDWTTIQFKYDGVIYYLDIVHSTGEVRISDFVAASTKNISQDGPPTISTAELDAIADKKVEDFTKEFTQLSMEWEMEVAYKSISTVMVIPRFSHCKC
jgi:hypothetical protein